MTGRITLAQVAARAGVSVMTASYTYNQPQRVSAASRERVLAAAEELGYPGPDPGARSLRRGRSQTIGVVLGEQLTYAFEDPQAASFLAGVAGVCAAHGYGMTILPVTGGAEDIRRVRAAAVDGFIVWTTVDDDPVLSAISASRRPAVVHGGPRIAGVELVGIDDQAAARAIGLVAFRRARRPAVVSFPVDRERRPALHNGPPTTARKIPFPVTRSRMRGYRSAARTLGHDWSSVPVAVCPRNSADDAEQAARELLAGNNPPDAIAAMSDQLAAGVVRAAEALGIDIPGQLALTGFDDDRLADRLRLSTVRQSLRDQGAACAQLALGMSPDRSAEWSVIERASTHPAAIGQ